MSFDQELVGRIAAAHGLSGEARLMPASGMVNEAWLLDERFVLRITVEEDTDNEAGREAWIVPIARAAGVRSPEIIVADLSRTIVDRPYTIYRRAEGMLLGELDADPALFTEAYRELGREFVSIHSIPIAAYEIEKLRKASSFDATKQLQKTKDANKITDEESVIVEQCIAELEPIIGTREQRALVHQDVHPWNMFVDPETRKLTAIIDWGDTSWGDPASEFASMPLWAVPHMLEGYAEAGGEVTESLIARSLHLGLALCLWEVRDLDPARFKCQWWRHSPKGFGEDVRLIRSLIG